MLTLTKDILSKVASARIETILMQMCLLIVVQFFLLRSSLKIVIAVFESPEKVLGFVFQSKSGNPVSVCTTSQAKSTVVCLGVV